MRPTIARPDMDDMSGTATQIVAVSMELTPQKFCHFTTATLENVIPQYSLDSVRPRVLLLQISDANFEKRGIIFNVQQNIGRSRMNDGGPD